MSKLNITSEVKTDIKDAGKQDDKSIHIKSMSSGKVNCTFSAPGEKQKGMDFVPRVYYDKTFDTATDFIEYAEAFFNKI